MRRKQTIAMGWLASFIQASWIVIALTSSDLIFVPLTVLWIAAGVILARRLTESRCPRCKASFFEKTQMPYFYVLFNHRCENCGLTLSCEDQGRA
jgi:hypothetical protein